MGPLQEGGGRGAPARWQAADIEVWASEVSNWCMDSSVGTRDSIVAGAEGASLSVSIRHKPAERSKD